MNVKELLYLQFVDLRGNDLDGYVPRTVADLREYDSSSTEQLMKVEARDEGEVHPPVTTNAAVENLCPSGTGSEVFKYAETFCNDLVIRALQLQSPTDGANNVA